MANCKSCSAPISDNSVVCPYCGTHNDIDLHGIHQYTTEQPASERICPRCEKPLRTINLKTDEKFLIEQCDNCMGLFFDPGELQALIENSVSNVFEVNYKRLQQLTEQECGDFHRVTYIKCPVCRGLMQRVNFGHGSGVITDQCKKHGIWLDGGELIRLLNWKKAGGQLLGKVVAEMDQTEKRYHEQKRKITSSHNSSRKYNFANEPEESLGSSIASAIFRMIT